MPLQITKQNFWWELVLRCFITTYASFRSWEAHGKVCLIQLTVPTTNEMCWNCKSFLSSTGLPSKDAAISQQHKLIQVVCQWRDLFLMGRHTPYPLGGSLSVLQVIITRRYLTADKLTQAYGLRGVEHSPWLLRTFQLQVILKGGFFKFRIEKAMFTSKRKLSAF